MTAAGRERRGRSWRQDPEGRRARVLAAAAHEFAARGTAARVADVAKHAEVAEGTVYHLFGSKRALLVAVGEHYGQGLAAAAFGGLGETPGPERVPEIVANIFQYVRETPGPLAAFLLSGDPSPGNTARAANRQTMLRAIEAVLTAWRRLPDAPAFHPRIAAEIQFGLVESALRDCFLRRDGADERLYAEEVTRSLSAMVGPAPAARRARSASAASAARPEAKEPGSGTA